MFKGCLLRKFIYNYKWIKHPKVIFQYSSSILRYYPLCAHEMNIDLNILRNIFYNSMCIIVTVFQNCELANLWRMIYHKILVDQFVKAQYPTTNHLSLRGMYSIQCQRTLIEKHKILRYLVSQVCLDTIIGQVPCCCKYDVFRIYRWGLIII